MLTLDMFTCQCLKHTQMQVEGKVSILQDILFLLIIKIIQYSIKSIFKESKICLHTCKQAHKSNNL